ncbi:hypothetical protein AB0E16_30470, partial [Streptomyces sp. NPDC047970]
VPQHRLPAAGRDLAPAPDAATPPPHGLAVAAPPALHRRRAAGARAEAPAGRTAPRPSATGPASGRVPAPRTGARIRQHSLRG